MRNSAQSTSKWREEMNLNTAASFIKVVNMRERLVSIPKSELEGLEATIETLQNSYVMEQLEKSEQDIQEGKTRNIDEFIKELEG